MSVDERQFREACGHFATGVTVVTARNAVGEAHGFTANSFTSVSLDPPLVLVCVTRDIASYAAMREASGFAVNILAAHQEELSRRFATPDLDKFAGLELIDGPYGAPHLQGVVAILSARVHSRHPAGDHDIFIGEVTGCEVTTRAPLVFFRGQYGLAAPDGDAV
ncbi:MAG: flavin reductase family protein [Candidatus Dormibacteria bacterium]